MLIAAIFLTSCASEKDVAAKLEGAWQGNDEKRIWCLEYHNNANRSINVYEIYTAQNDFERHMQGYWHPSRGNRFWSHIASVYDQQGDFIEPDKRNASLKATYVITEYDGNSITYISEKTDTVYHSKRVANCSGFNKFTPET